SRRQIDQHGVAALDRILTVEVTRRVEGQPAGAQFLVDDRGLILGVDLRTSDHANSRSGWPWRRWITESTSRFIQPISGARPSSSAASLVASCSPRFCVLVNAVGGSENAKQTTRASHSSNSSFKGGSWMGGRTGSAVSLLRPWHRIHAKNKDRRQCHHRGR